MIGQDLIIQVGMQVMQNTTVQAGIHTAIVSGIAAVKLLIAPFILPVLAILGIVVAAAFIAYVTLEVARWVMYEYA